MKRKILGIIGAVIITLITASCSNPDDDAAAVVTNLNHAADILNNSAYDWADMEYMCQEYGYNSYVLVSEVQSRTQFTYDEICSGAGDFLKRDVNGNKVLRCFNSFFAIRDTHKQKYGDQLDAYVYNANQGIKKLKKEHPKYKYNDLLETYYESINEYESTFYNILDLRDTTGDIDKQGTVVKVYKNMLAKFDKEND